MKKVLVTALVAAFVLQGCGSNSDGSKNGTGPGAQPGTGSPAQPQPPSSRPESANFFVNIDQVIAPSAQGSRFVTERFTILMARLSVYSLLCDAKNQFGWSTKFSRLYNSSTEMQALSQTVYGSEKAAYNRLEKQRNIESRRLSFESPANICALSQSSFESFIDASPEQIAQGLKTTARGSF